MMTQSEGLACPSSFATPWFCTPHPGSLAILLMQDEVLAGWELSAEVPADPGCGGEGGEKMGQSVN